MRAATEWTVSVNHALAVLALEHRTRAVVRVGQFFAPGSAQSFRGEQRLAFRQVRRLAGEVKLAALRPRDSVALDGALRKFQINRPNFG